MSSFKRSLSKPGENSPLKFCGRLIHYLWYEMKIKARKSPSFGVDIFSFSILFESKLNDSIDGRNLQASKNSVKLILLPLIEQ